MNSLVLLESEVRSVETRKVFFAGMALFLDPHAFAEDI